MNSDSVKQAITPLRLIFWGGLLCIFDLSYSQTTNGRGFRFDILNDAIGVILITGGLYRLSALPVHDRYATVMKSVLIVALLAVLDAIREHFIVPQPDVIDFALRLLGLVILVAIVAFCVAMRWLCEAAQLFEASRSWLITTRLFVVIYLMPLGLLHVISAVAIVCDRSFSLDLGPAGILLLPVFAIPLIHLFVSTSRMKRAAETLVPVQ